MKKPCSVLSTLALILLATPALADPNAQPQAVQFDGKFPVAETLLLCADGQKTQIISLELVRPSPTHRLNEWQALDFVWMKRDERTIVVHIARDKVKLLPWNTLGQISYNALEFAHQDRVYRFFTQADTQSDHSEHDQTGLVISDKDGNRHTYLCQANDDLPVTNRLHELDRYLAVP